MEIKINGATAKIDADLLKSLKVDVSFWGGRKFSIPTEDCYVERVSFNQLVKAVALAAKTMEMNESEYLEIRRVLPELKNKGYTKSGAISNKSTSFLAKIFTALKHRFFGASDALIKKLPDTQHEIQFKDHLNKANQGELKAQFDVGECYENGWGVDKNLNEAAKWYTKAAEKGHVEAQFHLGRLYLGDNVGIDKDQSKALKWFTEAANQGNQNAQCYLGMCFEMGLGVKKNLDEAAKWYTKAADQGDEFAVKQLREISNS